MNKILFVCHGNICRSPMAQYVFQHIVDTHGLSNQYYIDSCALSSEELGNPIHYGTKHILEYHRIPYGNHRARKIKMNDFEEFDYIIIMDESNNSIMNRYHYPMNKVSKLLSYCGLSRDVKDPWWTDNFDECYEDIKMGCEALFEFLEG